jgi:hypothetical protein
MTFIVIFYNTTCKILSKQLPVESPNLSWQSRTKSTVDACLMRNSLWICNLRAFFTFLCWRSSSVKYHTWHIRPDLQKNLRFNMQCAPIHLIGLFLPPNCFIHYKIVCRMCSSELKIGPGNLVSCFLFLELLTWNFLWWWFKQVMSFSWISSAANLFLRHCLTKLGGRFCR